MTTTSISRILDRMLGLFEIIRSAGAAGAAVERGGGVRPDDLRRLGIDAVAFGAIHRG